MRHSPSNDKLNVLPRSRSSTVEDCVANFLRFLCVTEAWVARLAGLETLEEVSDLVNEGVFVTDLQTWDPPVAHVGLVAVGDVNTSPTADDRVIAVAEVLQTMQVMQIPANRSVLAVDFERVKCLVATSVARRFEQAERAVIEVTEEAASVVDLYRLFLACFRVHALLDERLCHRRHVFDATVEPKRGVDTVGQQVTGNAAAGGLGIQTPSGCAALGYVRVDRPVLQEVSAIVEDLAQAALVD